MANLGDFFAAIGGHPVNRPQLDAMVAQSQELNGLRSAQTEGALATARDEQDKALAAESQAQARANLKSTYTQLYIKNGYSPEDAAALADTLATVNSAGQGDFAAGVGGLNAAASGGYRHTLSDPNADPAAAFHAGEALKGEVMPGVVAQPPVGQLLPGATPPTTVVSPEGTALIADQAQQSAQRAAAAAHSNAGSTLSDDAAYMGAVRYLRTGTLPPMGMGGGGDRAKILNFGANLQSDPNWQPPSWAGAAPGAAPVGGAGSPPAAGSPAAHPTMAGVDATIAGQSQTKGSGAALADMTKRMAAVQALESAASNNFDLAQSYLGKTDATGSPLINKALVHWNQSFTGDPETAAFVTALQNARNEYAGAVSQATGASGITDYANREANSVIPTSVTSENFPAIIAAAKAGMENRRLGMVQQQQWLQGQLSSPNGGVPSPSAAPPAGAAVAPAAPAGGAAPGDRISAPPIGPVGPGVHAAPTVGALPAGSAAGVSPVGPSNAPGAPAPAPGAAPAGPIPLAQYLQSKGY